MNKTTFTLAEAALLLNCHSETLRRAIRNGGLRAARLGRGYRLSRSDLQTFWTEQGGGFLFEASPDVASNVVEEKAEESPSTSAAFRTGADKVGKPAKKVSDSDPRQLSLIAPQGREP